MHEERIKSLGRLVYPWLGEISCIYRCSMVINVRRLGGERNYIANKSTILSVGSDKKKHVIGAILLAIYLISGEYVELRMNNRKDLGMG